MTEILLFHHAQGLTPGITALADRIREAGHTVHTPDLYDGHTFDSLDDGLAHAREVGFDVVVRRGVQAADGLPSEIVYAGVSLGVMAAQQLAQTRPGAVGGLFLESFVPPSEFGSWPDGVPAQIHGMDADPFFAGDGDIDAARAFAAESADAELFVYPGDVHLFTDSSLASYSPEQTDLLVERVLAFLDAR
ncbi:dienelactone hydrolase family protein [Nocardioides sp. CN2-186]|uniref:dienelactone hydrolase family protein n=1 Tax=Nocardioides tweenelious TaxID=3156607 RepID=UPI0032B39A8F